MIHKAVLSALGLFPNAAAKTTYNLFSNYY